MNNNTSSPVWEEQVNFTHQSDVWFPELQAALIIWDVWAPCLLLLGTFGNITTIIVMRRIKDRNSSQRVFLMALAVSDFCLLYTGVFQGWFLMSFHVDLRALHVVVCKTYSWLLYSTNTLCAWLVTSVTVQRTMAVLWPHRMRAVCTVRRTWMVIAALAISALTLQVHFLFGMRMTEDNRCDDEAGVYEYFLREIATWMDLAVSSFLPCVCLLVCDVILSLTLFKSTSDTSAVAHAISNASTAQHSNDSRRKTASRTTVLVLTLSCAFLVLTMPVCLFLILIHVVSIETHKARARAELALTVTCLLWYTNSAINFLLYCLTGTKFRKEFLSLVHCSTAQAAAAVGKTASGTPSGERSNV
ncbi:G-protein coupled receptor daf-37-like [Babylonia areolata]|uniref:G-protein coupled receptor daf-37-like n=1 Tax=Babylonia areolata TaxID=304850 RepID=UPI003FD2F071